MTDIRNDKERWHALLDAISDDIANMPDEMVLREHAQTTEEDVTTVSNIIQELVGEVNVSAYAATRTALEKHRRKAKPLSIPKTPSDRRSLIAQILGGDHSWSNTATMAFRDLDDPSSLTDEEIQNILEDLAELNEDDEG